MGRRFFGSTRGWVSEALRILVTLAGELKDVIERYDKRAHERTGHVRCIHGENDVSYERRQSGMTMTQDTRGKF
jgi:hypothetical protein